MQVTGNWVIQYLITGPTKGLSDTEDFTSGLVLVPASEKCVFSRSIVYNRFVKVSIR